MHRTVLLSISLMCSMIAEAQLSECRDLFFEQPSLENWENVIAKAKNVEHKALSQAFIGAATCSTAEYGMNPFRKLEKFDLGKEEIERAVQNDAENAEIRFLRLCIQIESPGFLDYDSNINEDASVVWQALNNNSWPGSSEYRENVETYLKKKDLKP